MKTFISHIHEESKLAQVLKEWVESTFAGQIEVFVSSDIKDIPAGSRWLSEIDSAMTSSTLFLLLCSPKSLSRPWINFEAGCAWIKKVPIIPLCHSGMKKSDLPTPISIFQGIELDSDTFIDDFFESLKQHFKISKLPRIDKNAMLIELKQALKTMDSSSPSDVITSQIQANDEIDEKAKNIIKFLANIKGDNPTAEQISYNLKIHLTECEYYLDILTEKEYIHHLLYMGAPAEYCLLAKGRKYAVQNKLLQ